MKSKHPFVRSLLPMAALALSVAGTAQASLVGTTTTIGSTTIESFTGGSGLWTVPAGVTSIQLLVVGGGGGSGAGPSAGGGGAGGLISTSIFAVTAGDYFITIGTGGLATYNGGDSTFGSVTALGGGAGGSFWAYGSMQGAAGGSGGGSATFYWNPQAGGAGTAGQGYAGGASVGGGQLQAAGGGGGGAGGAGLDAYHVGDFGNGGNGGDGVTNSISGSPVYYAGGGGGTFFGDPGNFNDHVQGLGGLGSTGPGGGGTAVFYWIGNNFASASTPGQDGIVILSYSLTAVPEPGAVVPLGALVMSGLLLRSRRRQR